MFKNIHNYLKVFGAKNKVVLATDPDVWGNGNLPPYVIKHMLQKLKVILENTYDVDVSFAGSQEDEVFEGPDGDALRALVENAWTSVVDPKYFKSSNRPTCVGCGSPLASYSGSLCANCVDQVDDIYNNLLDQRYQLVRKLQDQEEWDTSSDTFQKSRELRKRIFDLDERIQVIREDFDVNGLKEAAIMKLTNVISQLGNFRDKFDLETFEDYVSAYGFGEPTPEGMQMGMNLIFEGYDYAEAASIVVSNGLTVGVDDDTFEKEEALIDPYNTTDTSGKLP